MDGIALKPLTVAFHEPGFVSKLNSENQFGPWFTLSDREKQQLGSPMGPANPQSLNRYSYTLNNPIRYIDPSGHCPQCAVGALLAAAGIVVSTPVIIALAAAVSVLALAVFLSDETNRVWLMQQIDQGITDVNAFVDNLSNMVAESQNQQNPSWDKLQPFRGKTKTNGETGKKRRYYERDRTHGDVEVYDSNGNHLGSMNPDTGEMTKPPVKGRKIDI